MLRGRGATGARRSVVAVLVAGLMLATAVGAASAGASGPSAVAAKKCKSHRSAASAKKRKCKRRMTPPIGLPGPLVRATITWPAGEVDLHAFDASGNRSGISTTCTSNPCPMSEGIPNGVHSADSNNGGSETFTDNIFVPNGTTNREFAYVICFYTSTTVTFTGVNRFGQSNSVPVTGAAGEGHSLTITGGPTVPSTFVCP
jgi:hypothetical protein